MIHPIFGVSLKDTATEHHLFEKIGILRPVCDRKCEKFTKYKQRRSA